MGMASVVTFVLMRFGSDPILQFSATGVAPDCMARYTVLVPHHRSLMRVIALLSSRNHNTELATPAQSNQSLNVNSAVENAC